MRLGEFKQTIEYSCCLYFYSIRQNGSEGNADNHRWRPTTHRLTFVRSKAIGSCKLTRNRYKQPDYAMGRQEIGATEQTNKMRMVSLSFWTRARSISNVDLERRRQPESVVLSHLRSQLIHHSRAIKTIPEEIASDARLGGRGTANDTHFITR